MNKNKIVLTSFDTRVNFYLYESQYQNIVFAGKVIWYARNKFMAIVHGEEGLMLADFIVD